MKNETDCSTERTEANTNTIAEVSSGARVDMVDKGGKVFIAIGG